MAMPANLPLSACGPPAGTSRATARPCLVISTSPPAATSLSRASIFALASVAVTLLVIWSFYWSATWPHLRPASAAPPAFLGCAWRTVDGHATPTALWYQEQRSGHHHRRVARHLAHRGPGALRSRLGFRPPGIDRRGRTRSTRVRGLVAPGRDRGCDRARAT